ncbi:MAG: methylated-DNA--[protein]-cysteine S-methyltransferase [Gammaproteobacteria bacterium]|nr:methylated-DNA--[protein]-cysteine S-methyltransferase [Gammaproteobacteria bacterium]
MNKQINYQYYKTAIGDMLIASFEGKLCILDFRYRRMRTAVDTRIKKILNADFIEQADNVIELTHHQLNEYLQGTRKTFDVPLLLLGTDFQKEVWNELLNVSYGETASYQDIANRINNPKAVRAAASANGANSIAIIVPCHRIIESSGGLGGYGGGIAVKKRLLHLEKQSTIFSK